MKAELYLDAKCIIAESPLWDERSHTLYFADLLGNRLFWQRGGSLYSMPLGQNAGCVCLRRGGGLVAGLQHGFYFIDPEEQSLALITSPEADRPGNRFNDGKIDPEGRFWAGTMPKALDSGKGEAAPQGTLYRLDADLRCTARLGPVTLSNGLGWSPDGSRMYYIDTPTRAVQVFDFDGSTDTLGKGRVLIRVPEGMGNPDGMCTDSAGNLYVALWGGGCVGVWEPENGRLLGTIEVPAPHTSCCCFGGEGMDELFITSASIGTDLNEHPYAGGVFRAKPGARGLPTYRFGA